MFKVLILQASHSLSDERTEYLIKDRLSFMRFLGLTLEGRVPDANSIWNFREALTRTIVDDKPAIEVLFKRFDAALASGKEWLAQPDPSQEAEGQADAGGYRKSQRQKVQGSGRRRTCLRQAERPMALVIRTIGLARATMKIGLVNLTYKMKRMIWLTDRLATA